MSTRSVRYARREALRNHRKNKTVSITEMRAAKRNLLELYVLEPAPVAPLRKVKRSLAQEFNAVMDDPDELN